jgi:hypothetical protein
VRQLIERATPIGAFKRKIAFIHGNRELLGYSNMPMNSETRNEKLAKLRKSKLNVRHPPVSGYNYVPNAGKYVRPGPNGKPRLYNVKGNMSLSAAKIRKAYEEAGVRMPQYVQNLLGGAFVWYGASKGANRATSWNSKKNGHYVAPGPGKQPHFYKLPKDLKGGFATAKKRYNAAGMHIPKHVRNLFGVNSANSPVLNRPTNHTVQNNKVNGKSYRKLTTNQLVAVARNLGNAGANSKMTKNALFQRIKGRATIKTKSPTSARKPNVTVSGRTYIFSNDPLNQRIVRNGRARMFSTLPKNERTAIMNTYFRGSNEYKTYKPKDWYNVLRAYKGIRPATPVASPSRSATPNRASSRSRSATPNYGNMPRNVPGWN